MELWNLLQQLKQMERQLSNSADTEHSGEITHKYGILLTEKEVFTHVYAGT